MVKRKGPGHQQREPHPQQRQMRRGGSPDLAGRWGKILYAFKGLYNLYYSGPHHGRHERIGVEVRAYSTLHYVYTVIL